MSPEINSYPSRRFYQGRLQPAKDVLTRPPPPFTLPFGAYAIFDIAGQEAMAGTSRHNEIEVVVVIKLIYKFLADNPGLRLVAITSFKPRCRCFVFQAHRRHHTVHRIDILERQARIDQGAFARLRHQVKGRGPRRAQTQVGLCCAHHSRTGTIKGGLLQN